MMQKVRELFRIDWINTFRFNFKYFSPRVAILFPCILYRSKIIALEGKVELLSTPKTGMVKLGKMMVPINQDAVGFVYENRGGILKIGKGEIGSGSAISIQKGAELRFEDHFHATSRARIVCASNISIGKSFRLGWDCLLMDTDWHSVYNIFTEEYSSKTKGIEIGNYVWLANGVSVMKGTYIPNFAIVAGKSLVNRKLEDEYSIYAGSPAKLVKKGVVRDEFVSFLS